MDVALVMFKADGSRREFPLGKPRVVVGRTNHCDLRIPLSSVSRQHCELRLDDGTVRVRDLGSSNGTYHNRTRIQEAELEAGDEIVIGPVVFTVIVDGKPDITLPVRTILRQQASVASSKIAADDSKTDIPNQSAHPVGEETIDFEDPLSALEALASEETELPQVKKD